MRLSAQDASFLYSETASGPMHGSGVAVIEGEVPFEVIFQHIASRLHLVPRYRQRLALVPFNLAHPKWVDDPNFDLANHLTRHTLPEGSTLDDALEAALKLIEPVLPRDRPLCACTPSKVSRTAPCCCKWVITLWLTVPLESTSH